MLARRKFLKIMGVSTAAAPLAAKEALEAQQARMTLLGPHNSNQPIAGQAAVGGPSPDGEIAYAPQIAWSKLNGGALPAHIEKMARDTAKTVNFIDADIMVKRSWSLAAKIHEQRQRNYAEQVRNLRNPGWFEEKQRLFEKITGFRWRIW